MRHEPAGQQNRSRPFDDERAEQHAPCQTDNAAAVRQIKPRAHHHALVQRDRRRTNDAIAATDIKPSPPI